MRRVSLLQEATWNRHGGRGRRSAVLAEGLLGLKENITYTANRART